MEDKQTYRFPVDEVKAKDFDREFCKTADMILLLFPKMQEYGEAFWGTMKEIEEKIGPCPWNIRFDIYVKYYKEWFGKTNVIYYTDGKSSVIQSTEDGKTYVLDFWESRIQGKHIWNKVDILPELNPCIEELSKRLGLTL